MLVIKASDVERLLDRDRLVEALEPAMVAISEGNVSMPPRVAAMVDEHNGFLGIMPVYIGTSKTLATKLVSVYPDNDAVGLPSHLASILVFDAKTGTLLALMDGTHITALRTAAGSALATRLLARPDADVMVIIGTGVQAKAHGQAIPRVHEIKEIRVVGRNEQKARALAKALSNDLGITVEPAASFQEAAKGAGIICSTTHSPVPVVFGNALEPGTHVNSVGLNTAGRELDNNTVVNSLVFVESRESALAPVPAGSNDLLWSIRDGLITKEHIRAEIGELLNNTREGRTSDEQITLYKSVGVAAQDAVAAQLVLTAAHEQGIGTEIEV